MIPLRDNIASRRTPWMNYLLIGASAFAFVLQLAAAGNDESRIEEQWGMIPIRVLHPDQPVQARMLVRAQGELREQVHTMATTAVPPWLTLLTCIFLHGGWLHFIGNMWFLHIFGDNIEDRLGPWLYAIFYLASGVAASAVHLLTNSSSPIPTIGASGAIAGVMGAYLVLYPHARVLSLVPIFGFAQIVELPSSIFLGIWFLMQFFQGALAITTTQTGGVAWWAHIGGFVVGFCTGLVLRTMGSPDDVSARILRHESQQYGRYRYR